MVYFKNKTDKRVNDNEKRCKTLKEKEKVKTTQSQIIKQALSNSSLSNTSSKKILFTEDDDAVVETENSHSKKNKNGNSALFDSSDSEDENYEIKEKTQFSGKKGFELLNLQSTYGNDERFKVDERFIEDDNEENEKEEEKNGEEDEATQEKTKQLKILESVLGTPVVDSEKGKKAKKRTYEMIRYDASNKDHEIYEINNHSETPNTGSTKKKEKRKSLRTDKEGSPKPKVSKEKFYEVSGEIKSRFKEKKNSENQFSMLQAYGMNGDNNDEAEEELEEAKNKVEENIYDYENDEDSEMDYKCEPVEENKKVEETKTENKAVTAKGIWKESFFFDKEDSRFKEGLDFINKKNSSEANEASENYNETRKKLKEILRLHLKKHISKKDPFKHKVGGMNKKQLANSRYKNSKMGYSKRKPQRVCSVIFILFIHLS